MKYLQKLIVAVKKIDYIQIKELTKRDLPKELSKKDMQALLQEVLCPIMLKDLPQYLPKYYLEYFCKSWAETIFKQLLFERNRENKEWIKTSVKQAIQQGVSPKDIYNRFATTNKWLQYTDEEKLLKEIFMELSYPERHQLPWREEELYQQLLPFFVLKES